MKFIFSGNCNRNCQTKVTRRVVNPKKSAKTPTDIDAVSSSVDESTTEPAAGLTETTEEGFRRDAINRLVDRVEGEEDDGEMVVAAGELLMGEPRVGGDVDFEDEPGVFTDNEVGPGGRNRGGLCRF